MSGDMVAMNAQRVTSGSRVGKNLINHSISAVFFGGFELKSHFAGYGERKALDVGNDGLHHVVLSEE